MTPRQRIGDPRLVAAALMVLLVAQAGAVGAVRPRQRTVDDMLRAGCGRALPPSAPALAVDAEVQLGGELSPGHRGQGTAVLVNRGASAVVVLTTQAVLFAPAGRVPASPPEAPVLAGRLLQPGEFFRQHLSLVVQPCPGTRLEPGFFEVALLVVAEPLGSRRRLATQTSRHALVVRP